MNEITASLSFSDTHTIYKKEVNNFKISKFQKISKNFQNFIKFQYFQESYVIKQLLHLNLINMRFNGPEYNNIERGEAEFNIVVLCSIKPHIVLVQVQ